MLEETFSPEHSSGGHIHAKLHSISCISLTHTAPLFNIRILLCIMNRPQSFSVITAIAISFRPLYLGKLNGGNLNKLILEYH